MTEFELVKDLMQHFATQMALNGYTVVGASPTLLVEWPNTKLDVPAINGDSTNLHAKPWVRYTFKPVDGGQTTLGGPDGQARFKTTGVITHQIFTPPYQGLQVPTEIAQAVRKVYDGVVTPGGVWFRRSRPNNVGISESSGWWQYNVSVNFEYDCKRS